MSGENEDIYLDANDYDVNSEATVISNEPLLKGGSGDAILKSTESIITSKEMLIEKIEDKDSKEKLVEEFEEKKSKENLAKENDEKLVEKIIEKESEEKVAKENEEKLVEKTEENKLKEELIEEMEVHTKLEEIIVEKDSIQKLEEVIEEKDLKVNIAKEIEDDSNQQLAEEVHLPKENLTEEIKREDFNKQLLEEVEPNDLNGSLTEEIHANFPKENLVEEFHTSVAEESIADKTSSILSKDSNTKEILEKDSTEKVEVNDSKEKLAHEIKEDDDMKEKKEEFEESNLKEKFAEEDKETDSLQDSDYEGMPPLESFIESTQQQAATPKKSFTIDDTPLRLTNEDGWLDILGSGELMKKVTKPGKGLETRPTKGNYCQIAASVSLSNGTLVDEWTKDVIQGENDIVPGLDLAIALMEEDEESEVIVPSRLAYGSIGLEPNISPNSKLHYKVHLLKVIDVLEEPLASSLKLKLIEEKKETGNFWFKRDEFSTAIHCYSSATQLLREITDCQGPEITKLTINVYNNLANAQTKICAFGAAMISMNNVLDIDPTNEKAVYRKATLLSNSGELSSAIELLYKTLEKTPKATSLQKLYSTLKHRKKNEDQKEKLMCEKMFATKKPVETDKKSQAISTNAQTLNKDKIVKMSLIVGSIAAVLGGIYYYKQYLK